MAAASKKKKINSRERARKKELKKEKIRYELRRKVKKSIKKQLNSIFPSSVKSSTENLTSEELLERKKALSELYKILDSKQSKGLITKGRVNRLKSRCTLKFNKLIEGSKDSNSESKSKNT